MIAGKSSSKGNWKIIFPCIILLLFISFQSKAQVLITGKVTDDKTKLPLYPATILDKTTGQAVLTDSSGNYQITVQNSDELEYRYLGFYPEKYKVPERLTRIIHHAALISKREKLKAVEVYALTPYQQDSLERIKTVGHYLSLPLAHFFGGSSGGGFGVSMHPITYFSKGERRKRRFHKMYKKFEKDAFIDSRYTQKLVHKLTGLKGDSLRLFMFHHRPPYDFTRYVSDLVFWSWIKRQYKAWLEETSERKRPK